MGSAVCSVESGQVEAVRHCHSPGTGLLWKRSPMYEGGLTRMKVCMEITRSWSGVSCLACHNG